MIQNVKQTDLTRTILNTPDKTLKGPDSRETIVHFRLEEKQKIIIFLLSPLEFLKRTRIPYALFINR